MVGFMIELVAQDRNEWTFKLSFQGGNIAGQSLSGPETGLDFYSRIQWPNALYLRHHLLCQMTYDYKDLLNLDLPGKELNVFLQNTFSIDAKKWLRNKCSAGIGACPLARSCDDTCVYSFQDG